MKTRRIEILTHTGHVTHLKVGRVGRVLHFNKFTPEVSHSQFLKPEVPHTGSVIHRKSLTQEVSHTKSLSHWKSQTRSDPDLLR